MGGATRVCLTRPPYEGRQGLTCRGSRGHLRLPIPGTSVLASGCVSSDTCGRSSGRPSAVREPSTGLARHPGAGEHQIGGRRRHRGSRGPVGRGRGHFVRPIVAGLIHRQLATGRFRARATARRRCRRAVESERERAQPDRDLRKRGPAPARHPRWGMPRAPGTDRPFVAAWGWRTKPPTQRPRRPRR